MSLVSELIRRNVIRTAGLYLACAWLLVQVAETVFPLFGFGDTPARIVVIILAIGFFPALILSWTFGLTPEGLRREDAIPESATLAHYQGKFFDRLILVLLVIAVCYFALDKFVFTPALEAAQSEEHVRAIATARDAGRSEALREAYGDKSVVVLPFVNLSSDPAQEYFSDGITEEVLNLLAQIPGIRVISRTTAFTYKNRELPVSRIADELDVTYVLEGSVRQSAQRVRITTQLIDARSDSHLWSRTYETDAVDIFSIQDDIASQTVRLLKLRLSEAMPRVSVTDPGAYALALQARHVGRSISEANLARSNALYLETLAIDPAYAPAWVGLAVNYSNQATNGFVPFATGFAEAREAAQRALAVDPASAGAYAYLGWVAMWFDNDLPAAAHYYESALTLAPTDTGVVGNAALLLKGLGRLDEALRLVEYQVARDPLDPTAVYNLGLTYLSAGRWEEAIVQLQKVLQLAPDYLGVHTFIATAEMLQGNTEAALAAAMLEPGEAYRLLGLVMVQHARGDDAASAAARATLTEKYEQQWAYNIAYALAYCGDNDAAFAWLDKAVEYNDPGLADIVAEILFRNLHLDPRWQKFLGSIDKQPAQLNAIKFEVELPW
ncbi:tetratricopeptide repeat protein [Haliea sp. E17]|uniref:tetratricopeptide repeat protein n=1 Tax=Haliea sp. E17 TaxID=3401576 RepID=UPI003AADA02A